jgi:hypothetical protein
MPEVVCALRSSLHVAGDATAPLPPADVQRLSQRYIHDHTIVTSSSAAELLLRAFQQSLVLIVRGFPGTYLPALPSVDALLQDVPPKERRVYAFESLPHDIVHHIYRALPSSDQRDRAAALWWSRVSALPNEGLTHESSACIWHFC